MVMMVMAVLFVTMVTTVMIWMTEGRVTEG